VIHHRQKVMKKEEVCGAKDVMLRRYHQVMGLSVSTEIDWISIYFLIYISYVKTI
jgi:hypothetical protein